MALTMKTLLALAACALLLAACGSSSSGSSAATSSDDRDTARLKLQECLRKQGIELPQRNGSSQPARPTGAERQKAQAAMQGPCRQYAQNAFGNLSEEQRQELQDQFAKFAACMRQHGVDLPDIRPGQGPSAGGVQMQRNTPLFQKASQACEKLRPQRPGGGGPGGGAPS
jgi:hypothetical protein